MKTIAVLIALMLLGIAAHASPPNLESPYVMKLGIIGPYGEYILINAWLNDEGRWSVIYTDSVYSNPSAHFGNETGWVQIT